MPSFLADHFLRKLLWETSRRPRKIFLLRFDQIRARILCRNFIRADAPEHDFVFACVRVEIPLALLVHQRNRKGPVFRPQHQCHRPVCLGHKPMHRLISDHEPGPHISILRRIPGRENVFCGCSEHAQSCLLIRCLHSHKQSVRGFLSGRKGLLAVLLSKRRRKRTTNQQRQYSGHRKSAKSVAFTFNKL